MKKLSFILLALSTFLLFSCRKPTDKPYWDTELLAPIVNASMNINNLLPDSILQTNADSSLKIVYNNEINVLSIDTLFKMHDTTLHQAYNLPVAQTLVPGGVIVPYNVTSTTYQLPGVQLRTVIIKSGKVRYTIKSFIHEVTVFNYSIPSASLNGIPFSILINVPAAVGSTPGIYTHEYDLSGYSIDLTGTIHNAVNTIYTSLQANVSASATSSVVINPQDSLVIDNTFSGLIPYYAKGYFGENTFIVGPSTTDFSFLRRITSGTLQFQDVTVNMQIENPIGMDARMYINSLQSINTRTNSTVPLTTNYGLIGQPININRAAESGSGLDNVYPTYANFPLTTANSNIKPFIENLPDKLGYTMKVITNPLGNVSGSNDFIYSDKLLKASLNIQIPLSLIAHNLTLVDTLSLNIGNTNGVQNVHSGTLTLFANNGFPFDGTMQMYLLNDHNIAVDSVFGYASTIAEAPINASYKAIGKKLTKIVIPVSADKMNLLYNTKHVLLKVKFNTASQPNYMQIYSYYALDVNIVADFNYTVRLQ